MKIKFNIEKIRQDFPFLTKAEAKKRNFIYFDNAATTQKPRIVIDRLSYFYSYQVSNIFRGLYLSAEEATSLYEQARQKIASFIGAHFTETIFTSGATASINFVAATWGEQFINEGDEILVTQMEHHANFLPWQQLAQRKKAVLRIVPITSSGELDVDAYQNMLTSRTKMVAATYVSNVLGTTNDVSYLTQLAHNAGAKILIDGAQAVPHFKVNIHDIGADFLAFSGHKILGPTGVGILYIKSDLLELIEPYQFGGGMVTTVCEEKSYWEQPPRKFEAGTPPIAQAIGLAEAINYLECNIDFDDLRQHEASLVKAALDGLQEMPYVKVIGPLAQLREEGHLLSFTVDGMHAHDVAAFLDGHDISVAVRSGQHCAQPLHAVLGIPATIRISFYLYNTLDEVNCFVDKMKKLKR